MFAYLDNSSTTKPYDEVKDVMVEVINEDYGNPSSMHRLGINIEKRIKTSRNIVARSLSVMDKEIIFTSGGTEANNIAIFGAARARIRRGKHLITTKIEHPSVLNVFKKLESEGYEVTYINVDKMGILDFEHLKNAIREDTTLISIMYVNNEVGSIQPIEKIGQYIEKLTNKPHFHVDGIQAYGKIKFKCKDIFVDTLSISAHKVHGPKGIGALYLKSGTNIEHIIFGGGQELNIRPGTENTIGIIGFSKAVEIMNKNIYENIERIKKLKEHLYNGILKIDCANFNSDLSEKFSPHILNVSFKGLKGEVILHSLEMKNIYVSTGSACSSKKKTFSHVLNEMDLKDDVKEGAIRFSLSHCNSIEEIDYVISNLEVVIKDLEEIMKRS